jgi:hypothetical protein
MRFNAGSGVDLFPGSAGMLSEIAGENLLSLGNRQLKISAGSTSVDIKPCGLFLISLPLTLDPSDRSMPINRANEAGNDNRWMISAII